MKPEMMIIEPEEISQSALRALESYPQIQASPDFNRRVLERVLAPRASSRLELFCDRMDEFFSHPVRKLLGVTCLAGVLSLAGGSALIGFSATQNVNPSATESREHAPDSQTSLMANLGIDATLHSQSRLALMRELEIPYPNSSTQFDSQSRDFDAPAKREKNLGETDAERSSQCPTAFRSLV